MRIVADENIPLVDAFFADLGEIVRVSGRALSAGQLQSADLLLVRSVTEVNAELLADSPLRFVASATIGTDHVDLPYLQQRQIGFASAPGCNADSVADYVLSALFNLAAMTGADLADRTIGIVGVGNVGSRVQRRLQQLGLRVLLNDPPRAEREGQRGSPFCSLPQLLEECDTFCLHTPWTRHGRHPSHHLFDQAVLARLAEGSWLINAGRGAAVDNRALLALLQQRQDVKVVLDVWEPEPAINPQLAQRVTLATPHIAGYSLEGRMRGTEMIYQAVCRHLGVPARQQLQHLLPSPPLTVVEVEAKAAAADLPRRLINLVYDLRDDHLPLQRLMTLDATARAQGFDQLRKHYPERRQFNSLRVKGLDPGGLMTRRLAAIGFSLE